MARRRQHNPSPATITTTTRSNMSTTLTPDQITALLAKGRTRGDYEQVLREFLDSSEAGIQVPLDSGALAGKTAKQAKTGFDNAKKRTNSDGTGLAIAGANHVKVIAADD